MSRIGKSIINLPEKVELKRVNDKIEVKGPLGTLETPIYTGIDVEVSGSVVKFTRSSEEKKIVAMHGLVRALAANSVKGVTQGWVKTLEINGVGYRAQKKGTNLVMNLGFSHEVVFAEPQGTKIDVITEGPNIPTKIKISGIDKELVGQTAANIRGFKKPEPYKGKGIKYVNEYIKRKAGKVGKK